MAIDFKGFIGDIKKGVKGAGATVSNYATVAKRFAKTQDMQVELKKKKKQKRVKDYRTSAQSEFKKTYGRSYNPKNESRKDNVAYKDLIKKHKK